MSDVETAALHQYLTFRLDEELFAVDIAKVREVLEFTHVTHVPRTPEYMRGVINLRGNVVPIVDMRMKLGLGATQKTVDTCVVITEVELSGETLVVGALADSVQEVLELAPEQIVPPPRMGMRVDTDVIRGMGKREDQFVIILDVDRIFSLDAPSMSGSPSIAAQGAGAAEGPLPEPRGPSSAKERRATTQGAA
jgi:purine-binding chemotaxis protein CheW